MGLVVSIYFVPLPSTPHPAPLTKTFSFIPIDRLHLSIYTAQNILVLLHPFQSSTHTHRNEETKVLCKAQTKRTLDITNKEWWNVSDQN